MKERRERERDSVCSERIVSKKENKLGCTKMKGFSVVKQKEPVFGSFGGGVTNVNRKWVFCMEWA